MLRRWTEPLSVFARALMEAVKQSLGRMTLWFACHGVVLPWSAWAETCVSNSTLERYRRRALVAQLRVQRYRIARGPYFLRSMFDSILTFVRFMQFPSLLVIKVSLALAVCLLPFVVFFAVRVYLPVAQRIPRLESQLDVRRLHSTEAVVPQVVRIPTTRLQRAPEAEPSVREDSFFFFRQLDPSSGEGLLIQGKGSSHEEFRRGWRLSQAEELSVSVLPPRVATNLNVRFRPIPESERPAQCKLQVINVAGQVIFDFTFDTLLSSRFSLLKTPLARGLQEKLMPDFAMNRARLSSKPISIPMGAGESKLLFRLERLDKGEDKAICSGLLHNFEWSESPTRTSAVSTDRKSLLFLLFESMNADVAGEPKIMPWFSSFLRSPQTQQFLQHHSVDVRDGQSFKSLLGLVGASEGTGHLSHSDYIEKLRGKGYRIIFVGDFDTPEADFERVMPDVAVRIANQTYEARLTLSQTMHLLTEEGQSPVFILVRLRGMSSPWRPSFSDLNLKEVFFGGDARGVMDALIFSHLRTLDNELSHAFTDLEEKGILQKFDFIATAERGFDLGLNLTFSDPIKPTFSSDLLLNQETLRVPLGVRLADVSPEGLPFHLKNQNILSSHNDLVRSLWEGLGVLDVKYPGESRRLWGRGKTLLGRRDRPGTATRETDVVVRMLPVRSRLQEGVLFTDPDSGGGFLKYVSQPLPSRVHAPDSYGWPEKNVLDFQAGEQFRQVSRRGQKEELIFRVNNKFVREARRIIRKERNFPLRLRLTAHVAQNIDFVFEQNSASGAQFSPKLSPDLRLTSTQVDPQTIHYRVFGRLNEGEFFDLKGGGHSFRIVAHRGDGVLVACPEAFMFSPQGLSLALAQKTLCLLENPEKERLESINNSGKKAISFWLVEDENQICKQQNDSKGGTEEYTECLESAPYSEGRGRDFQKAQ